MRPLARSLPLAALLAATLIGVAFAAAADPPVGVAPQPTAERILDAEAWRDRWYEVSRAELQRDVDIDSAPPARVTDDTELRSSLRDGSRERLEAAMRESLEGVSPVCAGAVAARRGDERRWVE